MKSPEETLKYIAERKAMIEKVPLMYSGGSLLAIESLWLGLSTVEHFINETQDRNLDFQAYHQVANELKCGSAIIADKIGRQEGSMKSLSDELVKRLRQIDEIRRSLGEKRE